MTMHLPTVPEEPWMEVALCAQVDSEIFFPEPGTSANEARAICRLCTARDECLEYALAHREKFGVWGGRTERERRRMRTVA